MLHIKFVTTVSTAIFHVIPSLFFLHCCWKRIFGDKWHVFCWIRFAFCHPTECLSTEGNDKIVQNINVQYSSISGTKREA